MTSPQAIPRLAEHLTARRLLSEVGPASPAAAESHQRSTHDARPAADAPHDLAARIRLLIAQEGSASALARRCGCSEGAVRSWRDGQSDLSRTRCIALARALGISLMWLVAGEGPMEPAKEEASQGAAAPRDAGVPAVPARASGIDPQRLAATLRLLQSYVCMVGGSLNPTERADVVAELYQLLGDFGNPQVVDQIIAFHARLAAQLRRGPAPLS
jgi:hypothetical protein